VTDIGGSSLEVAAGESDRPDIAESLPLGATRLSRRFVRSDPVHADELVALWFHALALLGPLAERIRAQEHEVACATSKTFRNLGPSSPGSCPRRQRRRTRSASPASTGRRLAC
jgi:exopolyphosphatase/guanosine-5'-triphosphate,3'-diphosphate pyrophosphatase